MFCGAPAAIRTRDLCLRRAALYPAELRVHNLLLQKLRIIDSLTLRVYRLAARFFNTQIDDGCLQVQ